MERSKRDRRDSMQRKTEALWPQIARDLGYVESVDKVRPMTVNSKFIDSRCVLALTLSSGEELVLRADYAEDRVDRFHNIIARHRSATDGLKHVDGVSVPKILWQHPTRHFMLMQYAKGETAFRELDLCDLGLGDRAGILERVGRAVSALHLCSATQERKFWPKHHLNRVAARAQEVRSGDAPIRKQPKFLGLCAYLHRAGRRVRGASFQGAIEHGDLHFRNILIDDACVSFIDFANFQNSVPQNDIANLWLANCPDHLVSPGEPEGYGRVAEADWQAFLYGYGRDVRTDPVFQFCYAMRLFQTWHRLPAPTEKLSTRGEEMVNGVVSVADWLFENEPG